MAGLGRGTRPREQPYERVAANAGGRAVASKRDRAAHAARCRILEIASRDALTKAVSVRLLWHDHSRLDDGHAVEIILAVAIRRLAKDVDAEALAPSQKGIAEHLIEANRKRRSAHLAACLNC